MNTSDTQKKISIFFFSLSSLILLAYVICRGITLTMTNDEAFSFYNVYTHNFRMMCGTANTHWLNSLAIYFETHLLGYKEWMIRVHSFVSFSIFCTAMFMVTKNQKRFYLLLLLAVAVFLFNIYIVDFFSLARGYGLSLGFELWAFALLINNDNRQKSFGIYTFLSLATFSCYTCIFLLTAYFIYDIIDRYHNDRFALFQSKKFYYEVAPFMITCLFAIPNILFIRHSGDLEEGQNNGLIEDTLGVFLERSFPILKNPTLIFSVGLLILSIIFVCYCFFYSRINKGFRILFQVLYINVLLIEAAQIFFEIPYVFGRTALYIILLIFLLLIYIVHFLLNLLPANSHALFCLVILVLTSTHFIFKKNHSTTIEWWKSQGLERCIADLHKIEGDKVRGKKIGMHLAQLGTYTNYYQVLQKTDLNDTVYSFCENREGRYDSSTIEKMLSQDYLIMLKPYDHFLPVGKTVIIRHYENMRSDLLRIKK